MQEFQTRLDKIKVEFAEQGFNSALYYENQVRGDSLSVISCAQSVISFAHLLMQDMKNYVNIVPTSAHTGEGIPDLLYLVSALPQNRMAARLKFSKTLKATVLEVKVLQGLGTTIDIILIDGVLHEVCFAAAFTFDFEACEFQGDTIVLCGLEGPIVTTIRALLMPAPLRDVRVKNAFHSFKSVVAAQGVKISAKDLEKAVCTIYLHFMEHKTFLPRWLACLCLSPHHQTRSTSSWKLLSPCWTKCSRLSIQRILASTSRYFRIPCGHACSFWPCQASTLGSLEALLSFLNKSKIPVSTISIGPVHKKDVFKACLALSVAVTPHLYSRRPSNWSASASTPSFSPSMSLSTAMHRFSINSHWL